jgi:Domain of unknown function (DUF4253)
MQRMKTAKRRGNLIQTVDTLSTVLQGTSLDGRFIRAMGSFICPDPILIIEIDANHRDDELALLNSLIEVTGRCPVLTDEEQVEMIFLDQPRQQSDTEGSDWIVNKSNDALHIYETQYLPYGGNLNAANLIQTKEKDLYGWLDVEIDHCMHPLAQILKRFGEAPSIQEIRDLHSKGALCTNAELERWLFDWELARFGDAALLPHSVSYLDGIGFNHGDPCVAVLLPTTQSWTTLLHMGWYGCEWNEIGKAAAMRAWSEKYGAELVGSFMTTLHLKVNRRPQNVDEAFALALEHYDFASDTVALPGISIREHARALLSIDRWFFHSRP